MMRTLPVLPESVVSNMTAWADGPAAPPWPHQPTVEWQVAGLCNYDCSYCIQSKAHRQGQPGAEDVNRLLAFLRALPQTWEIKMSGGEPFASRHFLDRIVPGLADSPHNISVLTNLSAPVASLQRFARLAGAKLTVVSASLHQEFTDTDSFVERLQALRAAASPQTHFVVNAVLVPGRLPQVLQAREQIRAAGFRFFPQLMKVKHGVHAYDASDRALIDEIVSGWAQAEEARSANMAPSYMGRRCWSGARYFVLTQTGDVWSCRTAKRHGEGFLGNVHAGTVALASGPLTCPYSICPCAVPANRGMIEGVPLKASVAAP